MNKNLPSHHLLRIRLSGFLMGIAESIPGFSGSTVTLAFGVYGRFIDLINAIIDAFKPNKISIKKRMRNIDLAFGVNLLIPMLIGLVLSSILIDSLLETQARQLFYASLSGMILAVAVSIFLREKLYENVLSLSITIISFLALSAMLLLIDSAPESESPEYIRLFVAGLVGATAMAMPGISGSFVLTLFGVYEYAISLPKQIIQLNIGDIYDRALVLALGLGIGLVTSTKIIKYLLDNYKSQLFAFLTGLMFASLVKIHPFIDENPSNVQELVFDYSNIISVTLMLVLFYVTYRLERAING